MEQIHGFITLRLVLIGITIGSPVKPYKGIDNKVKAEFQLTLRMGLDLRQLRSSLL